MINKKHLDFAGRLRSAELPEGSVLNIRVLGTIVAFELSTREKNYLNQSGSALTTKAMEHSVFLRPLGNTVYLMPPYCITEDQLETVYNIMISILQQKTAE